MLNETEQMVALPDGARPSWVDPNGSETGYYRWSVSGAMLVQMAESASRVLDARERLGYLANVSALLDAGLVRGDEYLRILSQFSGDTEPEVGQSLLEGLFKVREVFVEEGDREAFAAYVQRTLSPILARIGRLPQAGEKDGVTTLRPALITWLGDDDECVDPGLGGLAGPRLPRPPRGHSLVARRRGHPAPGRSRRRGAVRGVSRASGLGPASGRRARWLTGLGWFRGPAVMDSALAFALHGPLRPQERSAITRALSDRKENYPKLYTWMTANYDAIIAATTPSAAAFMPFYAGGCSAERLAQAKEFFSQPAHNRPGVPQSLAQVSDGVNDCVGLREREGAPVHAFLKQVATAK